VRPTWEPRPDKHQPPLVTEHVFESWTSDGGWTVCIHLDGTKPCGRPEHEHAPAPEEAEA
jgi:hypothetical protein